MARIRTIKPEFWSSEQVMSLSRDARLAFIGIWNFCDDAGRNKWSPRTLKAQIFPGDDDITVAGFEALLREMSVHGLITEYSVNGQCLFSVSGWRHQKINRPQPAKYPEPPSSLNTHGSFTERSVNDQGTFTDGKDPKGRDPKGRELNARGRASGGDVQSSKTQAEPVVAKAPLPAPDAPVAAPEHSEVSEGDWLPWQAAGGLYGRFWLKHHGTDWHSMPANHRALTELARWCTLKARAPDCALPPRAVCETLLGWYFAQPWAERCGFGIERLVRSADDSWLQATGKRRRRDDGEPVRSVLDQIFATAGTP